MRHLFEIEGTLWDAAFDLKTQSSATKALERGQVLFLPHLAFAVSQAELRFFSPEVANGKAKNISFDSYNEDTRGTACTGADLLALQAMMHRYAQNTQTLLDTLLPAYRGGVMRARTSFRPVEVEGRAISGNKDDSRLHVDAFPSQPTGGQRILRVFTNVNRDSQPRVWHLGEPFQDFAPRFLGKTRSPLPGSAWLQHRLGITKARRSHYDHIMLGLHAHAKADDRYQAKAPKTQIAFPPGSTWIVYTDRVPHAALSGQHLFEQTFHLDVAYMKEPEESPLHLLENMTGTSLL